MKVVKKVNAKSSHHKEEKFFFFFYSVYDDECSLNIL